ncbi:DUF6049 family protein [Herbiconiux sp. CPCC 203407]|uniref:DUF6049 family protein n=1 Tax=Herbiconiux oxytropis TaxID=2970915 RepID=A0AA42BUA4_9MICO|nr:DUF6049 family protein [Herbiconiux oxytropis]MCS5723176.1 DUF6049 family protein [Herbiconiux oxytropis]MCS5725149.1 DUF6049 family protein [Herbiconiux oxytropis]
MYSPARRLARVAPAIAATALIAGALLATPMTARATETPAPVATDAPAAPAAGDAGVLLALAPASNGVVAAGADLVLTVEVTNAGSATLLEGSLEIGVADESVSSGTELTAWLAPDAPDAAAGSADDVTSTIATGTTPALAPGTSHTVQLTVPAAAIDSGAGVQGIDAQLTVAGTVAAAARSTIVIDDGSLAAGGVADVTVIAPITSVASTTGLIQPAALEAFTNDSGLLTRELDAVVGRPVTIAIDPRIIVSIRALGSTAPASAVDWLERLAAAPNPIIPLTFGDSDLSGEHQAGAAAVLAPTSFSYALDAADFAEADDVMEPEPAADGAEGTEAGTTSTPTPSATPTDDAQPTEPVVPTLEQLMAWDYTSTAIAWPRAGSVVGSDLPWFAASGLTTTILDSEQLAVADDAAGDDALPAVVSAGDQTVLVSDHAVSSALQGALAASNDTARAEALAELSSALALSATDAGAGAGDVPVASTRPVLAVLDRTNLDHTQLGQALDALQSLPWATTAPLQGLLDTAPTTAATVVDAPQPPERVASIARLLGSSQAVDAFSSVLAEPALLSGSDRADLLALLSNSWTTNTGGWNVAVDSSVEASATTLASVQVVEGSNINLLSNQADLPITLSNELPYPVTVVVQVTPSNGRLVVDENRTEVTIEASSRRGTQVPVTAVANGSVTLTIQLLSPSGVLISAPSPVRVNVSAEWETLGTVSVAALAVVVFGIGLVRVILRRRKAGRTAGDDIPAPTAETTPRG